MLGGFSIEQFGQLILLQLHEQQTNENHKRKACFNLIAKLGRNLYTCISYIIITKSHISYIYILYTIYHIESRSGNHCIIDSGFEHFLVELSFESLNKPGTAWLQLPHLHQVPGRCREWDIHPAWDHGETDAVGCASVYISWKLALTQTQTPP